MIVYGLIRVSGIAPGRIVSPATFKVRIVADRVLSGVPDKIGGSNCVLAVEGTGAAVTFWDIDNGRKH